MLKYAYTRVLLKLQPRHLMIWTQRRTFLFHWCRRYIDQEASFVCMLVVNRGSGFENSQCIRFCSTITWWLLLKVIKKHVLTVTSAVLQQRKEIKLRSPRRNIRMLLEKDFAAIHRNLNVGVNWMAKLLFIDKFLITGLISSAKVIIHSDGSSGFKSQTQEASCLKKKIFALSWKRKLFNLIHSSE